MIFCGVNVRVGKKLYWGYLSMSTPSEVSGFKSKVFSNFNASLQVFSLCVQRRLQKELMSMVKDPPAGMEVDTNVMGNSDLHK